jgi:hypothetical protein
MGSLRDESGEGENCVLLKRLQWPVSSEMCKRNKQIRGLLLGPQAGLGTAGISYAGFLCPRGPGNLLSHRLRGRVLSTKECWGQGSRVVRTEAGR